MRGVVCNILVCLAVWLAMAGRSVTDKVLAIVFPITAFVAGGFEHSIANMYFIPLGILLLACTILYIVPKTSVLGAILLTGYLGGAIATHVRVSNPLFTHQLFPVYLGVLIWQGLWLRDARVRSLTPLRD